MSTKICTKCKKTKSISKFDKNKIKSSGLNSWCKECRKEHSKKFYEENKDRILKRNKEWRKKNKSKKSEYDKKYRRDNPLIEFRRHSRQRGLTPYCLIPNLFSENLEINYHHQYLFGIAIPKNIHLKNNTNNIKEHYRYCDEWIKKLYCLDVEELLKKCRVNYKGLI
jgi:hypothetical protein